MSLREQFTDQLKAAMKAHDSARTSTLRMILARLKDTDIAARPKGLDRVADDDILSMLRGMVKSRRESVELYRKGNRPELVAKEEAEIAVIESFLPRQMDEPALRQAIEVAIEATGAGGIKDMGKVMAALKAQHGALLDMGVVGPLVKGRLSAARRGSDGASVWFPRRTSRPYPAGAAHRPPRPPRPLGAPVERLLPVSWREDAELLCL
jgi:uncharacterized protein